MDFPIRVLIVIILIAIAFLIILGLITRWGMNINDMFNSLKEFLNRLFASGI